MLPELGYYINIYLQSKIPRNFIERNARTSAGQHNVNLKTLNSIPIPLPPLREQKRILNKIDELFSLANRIERPSEEAQGRLSKIDMSILAKAFRGGLVAQDPNDEPASFLLDRIRSEEKKKRKPEITGLNEFCDD